MMHALELGASLYVPATRPDLAALGNRAKYPHLRSLIYCTEDAVHPHEVTQALCNLEAALRRLEPTPLLRYVRVRNPAVLRAVSNMDGVRQLAGIVVPKATTQNLPEYFAHADPSFRIMVTLETAEVFDPAAMVALRDLLLQDAYRSRVSSLRLGGNDLLQLLGLRRPRNQSIYATPLGPLVARLVTVFRPHGFNLTGPVFECLDRGDILARETRKDLANGLFGKSAIHPEQVSIIEAQYKVNRHELQEAEMILANGARPVFRCHDAMCEPATHRVWAQLIHERARLYGVRDIARRPHVLPAIDLTEPQVEST